MMTATPARVEEQLDRILQAIQAEPWETVLAREKKAFDRIASPFSSRLVLFGAGALGRSTLAGLRRAGVSPLAFADNNQRLWGEEVERLPVLSPAEAARVYGDSACFVVTIYNGSSVRRQLPALGCRKVASFAPLYWKYAEVFGPQSGIALPHSLRQDVQRIRACCSILADDGSRRELCEQLKWRYWLDYDALSPARDALHIYFPSELVAPAADEVFVDCGSFDGDTMRGFVAHWNGKFRHAFAFEPDPANRARLSASVEAAGIGSRVTLMPYAVGNENGPISFTCTSSADSHRVEDLSAATVECRRLDDIAWPVSPTYLKMDIEGAEPEALLGAAKLLRRCRPVLAICTYHRSEHLWEIPNLIHSLCGEYRIFLRRYAEECWEGVCYAIPAHRLQSV